MVHDYCDFEFTVHESDGAEVSAYVLAKNPYSGRAFRSAIEAAYGAIPKATPLKEAFAEVRAIMTTAARQKVIALDGEVDEPVPVTVSDLCGATPSEQCAQDLATKALANAKARLNERGID
jgi:hypothetical protein